MELLSFNNIVRVRSASTKYNPAEAGYSYIGYRFRNPPYHIIRIVGGKNKKNNEPGTNLTFPL